MMTGVIKALLKRSIEPVYWTAGKRDFMRDVFGRKDLFPNTIFHNPDDAVAALPAEGLDTSLFEPPGSNLIKAFYECELRSLILMEESDFTGVPFMKKLHLYHTYLKYWHGVLTTLKPDAIIYNDVPHMSYKYVAYHVAKYLGIKQLMLRNSQIGGRMFIVDDIEEYRKLEARIKANEGRQFTSNDLSRDIRDYYERQHAVDKSPFYARKDHIRKRTHSLSRFMPSMWAVRKNIRHLTFPKTTYLYLRMLFLKKDLPSLERVKRPIWAVKLQEKKWQKQKMGLRTNTYSTR